MAPAAVLAQRYGYETVAPDLPGYGLTRVPRKRMTYGLWIDCVCDLIELERARDPRPIALFGVSLGGLLAYQAAARDRVSSGRRDDARGSRERAVRRGFAHPPLGSGGLWPLDKLAPLTDGLPPPMAYMSKMHRISNRPS
jgi:pimeloyl-ACP methyl ester carboxylesterase